MRKRAVEIADPLDERVEVHDRHQFELKLEYVPAPTAKRSRYEVDVYVCAPTSLNVGADTVSREQVYADIHNYVRFKTPELSWPEQRARPDAPLPRADAAIAQVAAGSDPTPFTYECKLFACVFRAGLRELVETCLPLSGNGVALPAALEEGIEGATATLSAYRALAPRADVPAFPERARAAYRLADEYASLSVEQQLRKILVAVERGPLPAAVRAALMDRVLAPILAEEAYRRGKGWPSVIDPAGDNEAYVYRVGLLKKYCSSALFLHLQRFGARKTWLEILYAVAAGIAMAFATVVAFWAQKRYPGFSLQLLAILIVAYMFKDRLKEATRGVFAAILEKRLFDRKIVIFDPAGGELGTCQEKVEFVREARLPADAQAIRSAKHDPSLRVAEIELQESVIHYRKRIVLSGRSLARQHGVGVTDILRFHLGRFLHDMDEPLQVIDYMERDSRALSPVRAAKVYHLDVVFRFAARPDEAPTTKLLRLVVDRDGIKRVETDQV